MTLAGVSLKIMGIVPLENTPHDIMHNTQFIGCY